MAKSIVENIREVASDAIVKEQFEIYGEYVNLHRHIPYVYDGLKPSYRRIIFSALDVAKDKVIKTAKIVGQCISMYHPHGDASIVPVVSEMVQKKIFVGRGNHGAQFLIGEDASPAAQRYTEAGMSKRYTNLILPVLKYIPSFTNDLDYKEYEYIPTPIPLGLLFGYLGIGCGTSCNIPAFTAESILDAYLNNDPLRLKQIDGLTIENPDVLKEIWKSGRGNIRYRIKNYRDGNNIVMEGKHGPITLDYEEGPGKWLLEMRDQGRINYDDLTEGDEATEDCKPKLVWYKLPRVQNPTLDEIEKNVSELCRGRESSYIRVVYNNQVRDIGLFDWIDITYKNYKSLYDRYRNDEISKLNFDIEIYKNANEVCKEIANNKGATAESVSKKLNVDIKVVNSIMDKTLRTIRNMIDVDYSKKIKDLQNKIKEYKNLNIDKVILDSYK